MIKYHSETPEGSGHCSREGGWEQGDGKEQGRDSVHPHSLQFGKTIQDRPVNCENILILFDFIKP